MKKDKILNLEIKYLLWVLLLCPFLVSATDNFIKYFYDFIQSNVNTRIFILQQGMKPGEQLPLTTPPQSYLKNSPRYILLKTLEELGKMPVGDKRQTALYIPQSNKLYWNWLKNCKSVSFIAPAVSGMVMIDGLPAAYCNADFYGYESYTLRTTKQLPQSKQEICNNAKTKGFSHVIIIDTDPNQNVVTQEISCYK
ncbi:hypothetical protein VB711_01810 [Cronbergia sp. UHCC 0137]|uniref:hypothetical protein n=1 Tax=Cronbergia sp. UHCC 0137 TaxID=3110239 RepID=UPI002B1ECF19|nr:hypothetical protein [Cronbergia sp. UHCC 0137]MEA5616578.1 hypothetical protein [Cronbergia sp. UHCC 0137]